MSSRGQPKQVFYQPYILTLKHFFQVPTINLKLRYVNEHIINPSCNHVFALPFTLTSL